jgi:hypothetical protein
MRSLPFRDHKERSYVKLKYHEGRYISREKLYELNDLKVKDYHDSVYVGEVKNSQREGIGVNEYGNS